MPKICYVERKLQPESLRMVVQANEILEEYDNQGFVLTLRQLYYQFVARDIIPNTLKSYKRLGSIVNDARLAGLIDWSFLEDRTRNLSELEHFDGAKDALTKLASWYHVDMWEHQEYRPECWIEKDALVGVIESVCQENDVPFFSCRGYASQSEMWRAGMRLQRHVDNGQRPFIIHLGDHDPSGMDMSRDIVDRLRIFMDDDLSFERLALNMDQIEEFNPPPNPAKLSDSRSSAYVAEYGNDSWELDALEPREFRRIIENALASIRDDNQWLQDVSDKTVVKRRLTSLAQEWD